MPQLEGIKGELKAVNTRIDALDSTLGAKIDALNTKVEVYRRQLVAEIRRVEETLSADFVRISKATWMCGWSRWIRKWNTSVANSSPKSRPPDKRKPRIALRRNPRLTNNRT